MKTPLRNALVAGLRSGDFDRRDVLRLAALLGLGAGGLGACASPFRGQGRTLRYAAQLTDMLDIHSTSGGGITLASPALDFLCVVDAGGLARPALAESWTPSEDLRTWTFRLRKDARWLKGGTVNADQVLWNLRRWLDPAIGSAYLGLVTNYLMRAERRTGRDGPGEAWVPWDANVFEKVDDHTIRINLKEPSVTVAEDMFNASSLIVDPEEGGKFRGGCNGTGPFALLEYRVNDVAVFQAREDSWRGRPAVDRLEIVDAGVDQAVIAAALVSNQIQGVLNLSAENAAVFRDSPDIRVYTAHSANTSLARVHCDVKPFDDPRVRRAMRLAVDPERVTRLVLGDWGGAAQHSHVSPSHPDHGPVEPMGQDLAEARRLLTEAGLPNGFKTTIVASTSTSAAVKSAQVLSKMWSQIGIQAAIQTLPNELYIQHWRDFPLSMTGWSHRPLAIMTLALCYRTGSLWNESRYSNPAIDALIDQAQRELDPVKRRVPVAEIQRLLQQDGPLIQPIWIPTGAAFHRSVTGVSAHPMSHFPAERLDFRA